MRFFLDSSLRPVWSCQDCGKQMKTNARLCNRCKMRAEDNVERGELQTAEAPQLTLTNGQAEALERMVDWYKDPLSPQVFRLFGYAGTGKTTIAQLMPREVGAETWYYGAFSGKAVNVLRSKACAPAHTLHALIYGPPENLKQALKELQAEYDNADDLSAEEAAALREQIRILKATIQRHGGLRFDLAENALLDENCDLLIVDEVSMVNEEMARDLLSFGMKTVVLGDPFQLPPVRGEGSLTRSEPDMMLTEVTRQALHSPVTELATRIRETGTLYAEDYEGGMPWSEYDQILTWRRATRWKAVRALRELRGSPDGDLVPGDRIMCLANNKRLKVFNGQTWRVVDVKEGRNEDERRVSLYEEGVGGEVDESRLFEAFVHTQALVEAQERDAEESRLGSGDSSAMLVTYADALTVHKAQGSEWPHVMVMDETAGMRAMESRRYGDYEADKIVRRWLYTAVTRAKTSIRLVQR